MSPGPVGNSDEPHKDPNASSRDVRAAAEGGPSRAAGPAGERAEVPEGPLAGTRYRIVGQVAQDERAAMLRAVDTDLQRPVLITVMLSGAARDTACKRRFLEETRVLGQLQHPGIPPLHEIGNLPDGRLYYSMHLISGRPLAELLAERVGPDTDQFRLLQTFEQVVRAIAYAHEEGVSHRDIRPSNILVGAAGEVQVIGWRYAKRRAGQESRAGGQASDCEPIDAAERTGADPEQRAVKSGMVSLFSYMAPEEACRDARHLTEPADVFALGAILCEILIGQPPYVGDDHTDVCRQAKEADLTGARKRLIDCGTDPELVAMTDRCLNAVPERRYAHAGELLVAMSDFLSNLPERVREADEQRAQAERRAASERKHRGTQLAIALNVLMLLTVACVGAWWVQQRSVEMSRLDFVHGVEKARQEE
ncbi:MAG: serine/threonine protein kinase, partial [Planctomycetes bacterium]|nr:serine/threonine protein kinase [Planctomycetota bacterium]